ncbi:MAG: DUF3617 domain-containing protein [Porticoccaceae bacterium]
MRGKMNPFAAPPVMIVASLLLILLSHPGIAEDMPLPKAGLWEINMSHKGAPLTTVRRCVDPIADLAMTRKLEATSCSESETKRMGDTWVRDATCRIGSSITKTHAVTTGDLQADFETRVEGVTQPASMGDGKSSSVIRQRWLGACKPRQKPGAIEVVKAK